jgi:hypothetical protein
MAKHNATSSQGKKRLIASTLGRRTAATQAAWWASRLAFDACARQFLHHMSDTLIIPLGFNGPSLSGNGGYVAGMMANKFAQLQGGNGAVEVTIRSVVPIETPMTFSRGPDGVLLLHDGETLVCEARPGSVDHLKPPPPPTDWADVMHRGEIGGADENSDYGTCLVCGRSRGVGDGLRVLGTAGPQPGYSLSCYVPHANHADSDGRIKPEFVWGTLDCPGAFAAQDPDDMRPALTGRMTVKVIDRPMVGERCAVVGWRIGAEGRKLYSGTALYTESGRLCGLATQTWILLKS